MCHTLCIPFNISTLLILSHVFRPRRTRQLYIIVSALMSIQDWDVGLNILDYTHRATRQKPFDPRVHAEAMC